MKATLVGLPTWDHALYDAVCCVGFPALVYCAAQQVKLGTYNSHELSLFGFSNATTLALALSLGPLVVGATLLLVTLRPRALKAMFCSGSVGKTSAAISKRLLYPFHLDKVRSQIAQTKQQLRYTQVGPLTTQHVCPSFRSRLPDDVRAHSSLENSAFTLGSVFSLPRCLSSKSCTCSSPPSGRRRTTCSRRPLDLVPRGS